MKLFFTLNIRSVKRTAFLFYVLFITFIVNNSYAQTKNYANTAIVKTDEIVNSTFATDANVNNFATVKSYGGALLGWGKYSGELELKFPTTVPANTTTFVRIDFDADVLNALLGGNLGGLLANVLGTVVLGDHSFEIGARNAAGTTILSGASSGSFSNASLRIIKDINGFYYVAITPIAAYDRVYIKDITNAVLLGAKNETKVYGAYYTSGADPCATAFATGYEGDGLTVDLLGIGKAGVTNAERAIDADQTNFSEISLGALGVGGSISQNIYFSTLSVPGDEFSIRMQTNPALLSAGLLNKMTVKAYNGNTEVFSEDLNDLVSFDVLGLLNTGEAANIPFAPTLPFDRVKITLNSLLNAGLTQTVSLYSVFSSAPRPTFVSPSSNTINVCYNGTVNLAAITAAGNELRWYDVLQGGTALATTAHDGSYAVTALTANKTYYVSARHIGCTAESVRVPINIIVNPLIILTSTTLNNANVGTAYAKQITAATGGTPGYTYALAADNSLPAGLILSPSGQIGGTPTAAGDFDFNITATDSKGCTVTTAYALKVTAVLALPAATLPNGTVGVLYPTQIIPLAIGGSTPYTYVATNLPLGLSFDPLTREITGTPTTAGNHVVNVTVTDADGNTASNNYNITVAAPLALPTTPLADGTVGVAYPTQILLPATGGTGPYTYSATGLPLGLTFNPATREITGTPTTVGPYTVILAVNDAEGRSTTANYTINVKDPLSLPAKTLPDGTVGGVYTAQTLPAASGGTGPYTYATIGVLPPGLNFNPATRQIAGTPTESGNYGITLKATDATGKTISNTYALKVIGALSLPTATLANGTVGQAYPVQTLPAVTGGTAPYTYVATNLPPGLSFSTTTREITGIPTLGGTYTVSLTATDLNGNKANTDYSITIKVNPPVVANAIICNGSLATLSVSNLQAGVTYNWYGATGNTPLATNNNGVYHTATLTATTTFYVESVSGTAVSSRIPVTVTINPAPNLPVITTGSQIVNSGQSTVLQATANAGDLINWYGTLAGGAILATGPSFTTPNLTTTTIYYAETVNSTGCASINRAPVTVTVVTGTTNPNCNAAKSQNSGILGVCLLCGISGPRNSTDADLNNYTRISLAVGVGATGYQRLIFPSTGIATDSIRLDLATPTGLLDLSVLGGITVNIMNGSTVVNSYQLNSALIDLKVLGGTRFKATLAAGAVYDRVEVRFGAAVAALTSLDIYGAEIIYPKPTVAAAGQAICSGSTTTLTATPKGGTTLKWYSDAMGGTLLASGNTFTILAPLTATTTYYIEVSKAGCANVERVPVKVTVTPVLAVPVIVAAASSCEGATTILSVTNPDPAITYNWYEVAAAGTILHKGATFTTPILTADKIYYVEASQAGCVSATRASINVTVNPRPIAPQVLVSSSNITPGQTAILTASSTEPNVIFNWYTSATATTPIYTGTTYVTSPLITTTSYFVETSNTITGCNSATRIRVTINVDNGGSANPVPCEAALTQTNGVTGIALLADVANAALAVDNDTKTGSTLLMPIGIAGASVYQRLEFGNISNVGDTVKVLITAPGKLLSAMVLGNIQVSSYNVGASNNDAIILNNALINIQLLSGDSQALVTFVPTAQFDAVEVRLNSGILGALASLNVNYAQHILAAPEVMSSNVTACIGQTAQLTVKNPKANLIYKWYDATGVYQADGLSFTTPALTADAKYYVAASSVTGCISYKTAVNVSTNALAAVPELLFSTINVCTGSNVLLEIKNPVAGVTYKWYNAAGLYQTGKDGVSLTITGVTTNTSYSVEAVNSCGVPSARATATINVGSVDLPIVTPAAVSISSGTPAVLTASSSTAGAVFNWYASPISTTILHSGATYTTLPLTVTTPFYVEAVVPGPCPASGRASVIVTVVPDGTPETVDCGGATVAVSKGVDGVALLADVFNPGLAVDNKIETGSSLVIPVGALGASVYQRVGFTGGLSHVGDTLRLRISSPGKLLSLAVLPSLKVTTYNGSTSNNDAVVVTNPLINLELLSDNSAVVLTYVPTAQFDGVEVRLSAGLLGALSSVNFNYAQRINQAPQVTATTASTCAGSSAALSVKNPLVGVTYKWYLENTYQADGVDFNTPTTLVAGTYNFYVKAFVGGCESTPTKVVVTVIAPPAPPIAVTGNPAKTCLNTPVTLMVQQVAGITFNWYDATGNVLALNNSSYTTSASLLAGTHDFYVEAVNGNSCANATRKKITITVNPSATAADITVIGTNTICNASTTTLTASSTTVANPIFTWYSDPSLTTVVNNGAVFKTLPLSATTTYYVTVSGDDKCANSPTDAKIVTVTINPPALATDINLSGTSTICAGATVTLTASSTTVINPIFTWYKNPALTDVAGVGPIFTSPALTNNTTYYVTVKGDNKCENKPADAQLITITVNPLALSTDIVISGTTEICDGANTVLNASSTTVTNPIFTWYSNPELTAVAFVGAVFTTPNLTANTTYYVTIKGDNKCESTSANAKIITVKVKDYATAADLTLANANICSGNSATLTASSFTVTNPVFTWYNDPSLTSVAFVGPIFVTPTLTATKNYYVTVKGTNKCENIPANAKVVTITVNALAGMADILVTGNTNACAGSSVVLTASSPTVTNPVFTWYADAALTNLVSVGKTFTSQPLSTNTTFYVTVKGDNRCANAITDAKVISVSVKPIATAADITANNATICEDTKTTLVATTTTVTNPVFTWYNNAALTSVAFIGASFTTPKLTADGTYFVTVKGDNKCENTSSTVKIVTVTVNSKATAADINLSTPTVICGTGSVTINASSLTVTNPVFTWYSDASLTNVANIGPNFTTTLSATTTYFVTVKGTNRCENIAANAKPITITVKPIAVAADLAVAGTTTICEGSGTVLTASSATVTNPVFTWYTNPTLTAVAFIGPVLTASNLTTTTTYFVTVKGDNKCENTSATAVIVTVNPRPSNPVIATTGRNICAGDVTTLTVQNAQPGIDYEWYDDATAGTLVHNGAIYDTPIINATTEYYVQAVSATGCSNSGGRVKVTVTATQKPLAPTVVANSVSVCIGNTTVLSVNNPQIGLIYTWYTAAVGGTELGVGTDFTTPTVTANTVYFVGAGAGSCLSTSRTAVTINALAVPLAPTSLSAANDPICAGSTVSLTVNNPDPNLIYKWYSSSSNGTALTEGITFTTPSLSTTTIYYVESISKSGGCPSNTRTAIKVNVLPVLIAPVVRVQTTDANSITFAWNAVTGATAYEVSIDNGLTWQVPTGGASGTTYVATGLQPGQSVTIIVRAKGQIDCQTSANSTAVKGTSSNPFSNDLFVPNTFTPNGDGKNDIFYAYGNQVAKFKMRIYNQWGEFLYEAPSIANGWDGRYKGNIQPNGVYVYQIDVTFDDGTTKLIKGTVTLLR